MRHPALGLRVLSAALVALLVACDATGPVNEPAPGPPTEPTPLAALLTADGDFQTFAAVAAETDLDASTASGATTTLAPDDEAFSLMSPESLGGLRGQPGVLAKLSRRHVVTVALDPATLADGDVLPTLEGTPLAVRVDDEGTIFIGGARLRARVGSTPSGPVYRLSRVLRDHLSVAERIGASPLLSRSATLFASAGVDVSQPGTYFVPIDVGYDQTLGGYPGFVRPETRALTAKTLRALVIPGAALSAEALRQRSSVTTADGSALAVASSDGLTVLGSEARILVADIPAGGSVIHLVDVPPQGHLSVLERIRFAPTLSSFAGLLTAAGVASALDGEGPFTVFAATNDAFSALGTDGQQALVGEPALRTLVARFQISPQIIPAADLVPGRNFPTLSPQQIKVRPGEIPGGSVRLSRASLGAFVDLPARNGRLHVVTELLNPDVPIFDQLVLSGFGRFRELARRTGYEALLSSGTPVSVFAPRNLTAQALLPGFECRAREIAGDHITAVSIGYSPMTSPFDAVGGGRLVPLGGNSPALQLNRVLVSPIDVTLIPLGQSPFEFTNLRLADGSILHGLEGRLRWYASNGPSQNLPACTG